MTPMLMPFGAHKGRPLSELPDDYILWVACLNDLRQPLLGNVLKEMARRMTTINTKEEGVR